MDNDELIGHLLDEVYRLRTAAAMEGEFIARLVSRYKSLPIKARDQLNTSIDRMRATSRGGNEYTAVQESARSASRRAAGMNQFFNRPMFEQELEARRAEQTHRRGPTE